jgi:hypothetical protein
LKKCPKRNVSIDCGAIIWLKSPVPVFHLFGVIMAFTLFGIQTMFMKKIFITFLILAAFLSSIAQTQKGSFLIGGNATAEFNELDQSGTTLQSINFSLSPKVGFFVHDNLCFGASTPFSTGNTKVSFESGIQEDYDVNYNMLGVGPFVRYYFPLDKLHIITETSYTWSRSKSEQVYFDGITGESTKQDVESTTKTFHAASGVGFLISTNVTIELLLNYQNVNSNSEDTFGTIEQKRNRFFLSVGFQIYIPQAE